MKFALYALGALCFIQLAFAQDVSDSSSSEEELKVRARAETTIQCVEDKVDAFKAAAQSLVDNVKSQCFTEANQSPETTAALANLKTKIDALDQAVSTYRQSPNLINGSKVFTATVFVRNALNDVFRRVKANQVIRECVQKQVNTVSTPLVEILSCFKR